MGGKVFEHRLTHKKSARVSSARAEPNSIKKNAKPPIYVFVTNFWVSGSDSRLAFRFSGSEFRSLPNANFTQTSNCGREAVEAHFFHFQFSRSRSRALESPKRKQISKSKGISTNHDVTHLSFKRARAWNFSSRDAKTFNKSWIKFISSWWIIALVVGVLMSTHLSE